MSSVKSSGGGKRRQKGDHLTVAAGRRGKDYQLPTTRGLSNIPHAGTEVGSAAYRRLTKTKQQRGS